MPLPACSRISIFTSINPSFLSSINVFASVSGISALVVACSSVSSLDGCLSFSKYCEYNAAHVQLAHIRNLPLQLAILSLSLSLCVCVCPWKPTIYNPIRRHRALLLLEMLNDPVRVERVGHLAAELVVDA